MNSTIFLLGLVVFLVVDLNASKTDELYLPIFSLTKSGINTNSYEKSADGVEQMFGQKVDHFGYDDTTFQQRYFVNKKFANDSKIHFLFVEGRVVADSSRVTNENTSFVRAAKDLQATVWSLEHRFFGKSRPADDTSLSSLYTLTVDQSLADIADFINGQNKASGEKSAKWVVYGSFYGGTLALWFRQRYPSLSVGVVASSAPVQTTLDFYKYHKNVENTYYDYKQSCGASMAQALLTIRQLVQYDDGRYQISAALKLQPSLNTLRLMFPDFQYFFLNLATLFRAPVQFNQINNGGIVISVNEVCNIFEAKNVDDLSKVAKLAAYVMPFINDGEDFTSWPNNHTLLTQQLSKVKYDNDGGAVSARLALWQDCTQLGWFQTTDYGGLAFASTIPNNFFLNLCTDVFGDDYDVILLKKGLKKISKAYGNSFVYKGSNTVITIGSADPWRSVGFNMTADASSTIIQIKDGAQSADMAPISAADSISLRNARKTTNEFVKKWINSVDNSKSKSNLPFEPLKPVIKEEFPKGMNNREEIKNWNALLTKNITAPVLKEANSKKSDQTGSLPSLFSFTSFARRFNQKASDLLTKGNQTKAQINKRYSTYNSIQQDLDHFDSSINTTFTQYYYSNDYYGKSNGPCFLMLGGEGPISYGYVSYGTSMNTWARDFDATMFALEHRYYGTSLPTEDLSVDNLKWLTTEQALADTAVFVKAINQDKDIENPKWVVFGGSYAGNLAAWLRLKYPSLVVGAVASSAPVQAKVDLFEYLQIVSLSTRTYGYSKCAHNVHKFFVWAQQQTISIKNRKKLSQEFNLCDKWESKYVYDKDVDLILAFYVFFVAEFVQYDDQDHDYVRKICEVYREIDDEVGANGKNPTDQEMDAKHLKVARIMANGIKAKARVSTVKQVNKANKNVKPKEKCPSYENYDYDPDCQDEEDSEASDSEEKDIFCEGLSYEAYVDMFQQITPFDSADRCWVWQTCNELGVFQSSNSGYNLFESTLPVNFNIDFCKDVFGPKFTRDYIDANVQFTNNNYGGQDFYNGTNVVFANGSEDPWHTLSVYEPLNPDSVLSILIKGTSHCEDMYEPEYDDKQVLVDARKKIKNEIAKWL